MSKSRKPPAPLTTPQLIELAKRKLTALEPLERRGRPMTDYRFAQLAGLRQNLVSNWQLGKSRIGRQFVTKFAELTGLPEAYVFACVELERERDPGVRAVLLALAAQFASVAARRAAAVILATGVGIALAAPAPSQAAPGPAARGGACILWQIRSRFRRGRRRRRRSLPDVIRSAS
jgi:transcriptional regulator with XRE-family HTH domain